MESKVMTAQAVAYIGFAGTIEPFELDQPIAICEEAITDPEGNYSCNIGRMINSGPNSNTSNTGAWTNFTQPCETANNPSVSPLVCGDGNPNPLTVQVGMGTTNGEIQSTFGNPSGQESFYSCWWRQSNGGGGHGRLGCRLFHARTPVFQIVPICLERWRLIYYGYRYKQDDAIETDSGIPLRITPLLWKG